MPQLSYISYFSSISWQDKLDIAMIVIVWVSAFVSAFLDNIPFTTAMVRGITPFAVHLEKIRNHLH